MASKKDENMGYTPKGTYLDAGLTGADKAAVEDLSRQWSEAQAKGDQAAMDAAHKAAEAIRSGYGYSGGGDGSEYIALPKQEQTSTPGDWIGGGKATGGSGSGAVGSWGGGQFSYSSAPTYTSKYQGKIDALTEQILGRAAFEYDPEKDPTYQQYKESYTRNGERAMQDTLGQVSARTGGLASSYAGAAAQQTYDGYMSALADKIPELRQLAYQMYQDEGATQRANLEMLQALESGDYNKYLTLLGQYNSDRSFDYGMFQDQVGMDQWQMNFDRGVFESDRDFAYQVGRDQLTDQRYDQEYADSRADTEWEKLNYTSEQEYNKALQKAQTLAAAGDFSGYLDDISKAAGVPYENIANLFNAAYRQASIAALGEYRGEYAALKLTTDPEKHSRDYYDVLYRALQGDRAAYEAIYEDMVGSGTFSEEKVQSAMEKRMKDAQGVTKASELEQRYLSPDQEKVYDRVLGEITGSEVWRSASTEQRDKLEDSLYDLTVANGAGVKLQEKIDAGATYGIDEADYLLFRLALDLVDQPTESGKMGSYTNDEVEEAIRLLTGLSDEAKSFLWTSQGKSDKSNPWG